MKSKKKKNNQKKIIVIIVIICFFVLCFALYKLLLNEGTDNKAIYGDRLDDIKEVKIDNSSLKNIEKLITETGKTNSVEVKTQGKIVNATIEINQEVTRDDSKTLADIVLNNLTDEEKKLYDVQIFIDKQDDETFPIIGYHHPKKEGFSWTLDR